MLDKLLFWVVLAWMIGMLVMAFIAVREVWRDTSKAPTDEDDPEPSAKDAQSASNEKSRGT